MQQVLGLSPGSSDPCLKGRPCLLCTSVLSFTQFVFGGTAGYLELVPYKTIYYNKMEEQSVNVGFSTATGEGDEM